MADRLDMRPEQLQIARLAVERASAHDPTPVLALLYPGFGKEWGWQHAAVELLRAGLIDTSVTYTPRINLCEQAELKWQQERRSCYAQPRPDSFVYTAGNRTPLLQPPAFGIITTNSALVTAPSLHLAFAQEHSGRFLLVGDEAAAFGANRLGGVDELDEVKQAKCFGAMSEHAAVTILLTGADRRSDGRMLVGCEDRYVLQNDGSRLLRADVQGLYRLGVSRGYLRRIEVSYRNAQGNEYFPDGTVAPVTVSEDDGRVLAPLLVQPRVWQPMVFAAIRRLRAMRGRGHRFVAGIACRDQDHAKRVCGYAREIAGDLVVEVAVSEDRGSSQTVLRRAMRGEVDVLVFVRQAFIGFDCPSMAVLCVLTHWRFDSFLTQLVGRVLRIWDQGPPPDKQYAWVLTFADERSLEFFERMVEDARLGLRDRGPGGEGPGPGVPADIRDGELLEHERVQEHDVEHDDGGRLAALREALESPLPVERIRAILESESSQPSNGEPGETMNEQIQDLLSRAAANVKRIARLKALPGTPQYQEAMQTLNSELGKRSVFTGNGERISLADAQRRYETSCQMARDRRVIPV